MPSTHVQHTISTDMILPRFSLDIRITLVLHQLLLFSPLLYGVKLFVNVDGSVVARKGCSTRI
jgi:hypothetical protein